MTQIPGSVREALRDLSGDDLEYDVVAERRDGIGWSPHCHCEAIDEGYMAREQAIEIAGRHAAEHGGQWAEGEPSTEGDHR